MIQMSVTMVDGLLSTRPAGELNVWCYSFLSTGECWSHNANVSNFITQFQCDV